ncbi:MAG: CbrC family protein, partial [Streptococcus salivarius]
DVAEYLVKDGSMCGYLFRCLHCEQYHLWVDAD